MCESRSQATRATAATATARHWRTVRASLACLLLAAPLATPCALADGKLLATGGGTELEGSAGGGLVPWALLAGYGTNDELGGSVFFTRVDTGDYKLNAYGANFTLYNRVELSAARQEFFLGALTGVLHLSPDMSIRQDVYGVKVRVYGDAVYGAAPQVSVGLQYKKNLDFAIPSAVGAKRNSDEDYYVAVGKLFLDGLAGRNLWLNVTARETRANQLGILGFGGDRSDSYHLQLEVSAAVFLDPRTAVGVEYRQKPNNLSFARENDWKDAFIGYFPNKHLSFIAAYAELGSIATLGHQNGLYLSVQASF
jgi:DUF3034 family protein